MKTRTTGSLAEILVTVPVEDAERISEAIRALLDANTEDAEEILYSAQEVFPEGSPGMALHGLRVKEGLTQEEMSKRLNITQSRLSELETGKRAVSKDMARRIGTAFNLDYRMFL